MAKLVPLVAGRNLASAAEKKLSDRFQKDTPDEWVLMHSVGFIRHRTKRWAEADFVLVCEHGVFCLEVKGGRVSCVEGIWSFTDRFGNTNTSSEGPFDQAGGVAGALQAWLPDHNVVREDGSRFQVGYGVMTPDCEIGVESPSIDAGILFDKRDSGAGVRAWAEQLGTYWQKRQSSAPLSPTEVARLSAAIRPSFDARATPRLVDSQVVEEFVRLTEQQLETMKGLGSNERVLVSGAAGTGKTLLALEEAERLSSDGRVLLVCFSDRLAESFATRMAGFENVVAVSIDGLARWIIEECDAVDRLEDAEESYLRDRFRPELARRLFSERPDLRFSAMVVDEAQDIRTDEYAELLDSAFVHGFGGGKWRLFQDPNQNLFGKADAFALDLIESGQPAKFSLETNCRNTSQIVNCADLLSEADVTAKSDVQGPEVQTCQRWDDDILDRVGDHVRSLLAEGNEDKDIAVLGLKPGDMKRLPKLVREISPDVHVSTVDEFKGLEANVVVLVADRDLSGPAHRQAMYVGATRARVRLIVVIPGRAKHSYDEMVKRFVNRKIEETSIA